MLLELLKVASKGCRRDRTAPLNWERSLPLVLLFLIHFKQGHYDENDFDHPDNDASQCYPHKAEIRQVWHRSQTEVESHRTKASLSLQCPYQVILFTRPEILILFRKSDFVFTTFNIFVWLNSNQPSYKPIQLWLQIQLSSRGLLGALLCFTLIVITFSQLSRSPRAVPFFLAYIIRASRNLDFI